MKVICNKCGKINTIKEEEELICPNCNNLIKIEESQVLGQNDSDERLIFYLEKAVLEEENVETCLQKCIDNKINNDLVQYLLQKMNKNYHFDFLNDKSGYKDIILKDILNSETYSLEEKREIIKSLDIKNKESIEGFLDNSFVYTEESIKLKDFLYQIPIDIPKNEKKISGDLSLLLIVVAIASIVLEFLFGLFLETAMGRPIIIILSIFPAILLGIVVGKKLVKTNLLRIIVTIISILILFYLISYFECISFNGLISIKEHFLNMINAIPDLIKEIFKRLDEIEDLFEPEPPEGGEKNE